MGFSSKTTGKKHKVFLRKPKQICVTLHRYKWKSKLVDEKKNWKQFAGFWILHNIGYDGECIESSPLWVVPNAQICKWFKTLFEVMGLVIVKSTSTFFAFYVMFYKQFQNLHLYTTNKKKELVTHSNSNSKIKIKKNSSREATQN